MDLHGFRVGIIGGSLGGLSAASVLSRAGASVVVMERGGAGFEQRGGGLGVVPALARAVGGGAEPPHLVHRARRVWVRGTEREEPIALPVTSFGALWRWLRGALPEGTLRLGRRVIRTETSEEGATLTVDGGEAETFDLVVAADGGTSVARAAVRAPEVNRRYAGYVLWRGLVPASAVGDRFGLMERFHIASSGVHHLVAYPIPAYDGSLERERRTLNWGWYFPLSASDLPELTAGGAAAVPHALDRHPGALAAFERACLAERGRWPDWVHHLLERTLAAGALSPHPVHDYSPERLVGTRLALLGDAAHLASPITGSGARMAMEDALLLGAALAEEATLPEALSAYERRRLPEVRAVVQEGRAWGAPLRRAGIAAARSAGEMDHTE